MEELTYVVRILLTVLTGLGYPATLILFAKGEWHLGKRFLAATATFGFLLAVVVAIRTIMRW